MLADVNIVKHDIMFAFCVAAFVEEVISAESILKTTVF
jgi:hypothetical protein